MSFHLAQVNIAVAKYGEDDERFSEFVGNLDRINALADSAQGFVWRYISDDNDAEARAAFGNDKLLFNMSLWSSLEDLKYYVYQSDHVNILRQRADWFIPQGSPSMVLWWQREGQIPTVAEAKHRLDCLTEAGPTEEAFTFRSTYDMPMKS